MIGHDLEIATDKVRSQNLLTYLSDVSVNTPRRLTHRSRAADAELPRMATSWRCLLAPWTVPRDQKLLRQCFALRSRKTQFLIGSGVHRHHLIGPDVPDNRPMAVGLNLTQTDMPTTTDQVSCSRQVFTGFFYVSSMTLLTCLRRFYDVSTTLRQCFHDVSTIFLQCFYDVSTTFLRRASEGSTMFL